jgi:hypothetical protein
MAQSYGSILFGHGHAIDVASAGAEHRRAARMIGCLVPARLRYNRSNVSPCASATVGHTARSSTTGCYQAFQAEMIGRQVVVRGQHQGSVRTIGDCSDERTELSQAKLNLLNRGQGDGFRRELPLPLRDFYLASDGSALTTTLTTNPGFALAETNALVMQWAATKVVAAGINFYLPRDYDQTADELRVRVFAQMGGATDTPTLALSAFRKRLATALTADQGPFTGKAESPGVSPLTAAQARRRSSLSNTLKVAEFDISKKSCQPGDLFTLTLTPAAHGTDALNVYGIAVMFRTTLALYTESAR